MKLRELGVIGLLCVGWPRATHAGGLYLPGSGAISTSRAGAAVASTDDGEALSINPAGLAKTHGTTITVSAALIYYSMQFSRSGTYDALATDDQPYEGTPYETIKNDPSPPLGIGKLQPIPVIAIVTDFGGKLKNLRIAGGLYAPNAYPFRNMSGNYVFNGDFSRPPPASRYDIIEQEAAVILPSVAASYRIAPNFDVGVRASFGNAHLKSTVAIWGNPGNVNESIKEDALFTVDAKDNFIFGYGIGATFRPTPQLELAAVYNSSIGIQATGQATSENGPAVSLNGEPFQIGPSTPGFARCDTTSIDQVDAALHGFAR